MTFHAYVMLPDGRLGLVLVYVGQWLVVRPWSAAERRWEAAVRFAPSRVRNASEAEIEVALAGQEALL
jgi:hypothetical protein